MNQELITRCEAQTLVPANAWLSRFKEALQERALKAYESLYDEFITSWMKSPNALIRTPGFDKQAMSVAEVIADDFAGESGEADQIEMFRIFAEVAKTETELGQKARDVMNRIANRHASFHQEDAL